MGREYKKEESEKRVWCGERGVEDVEVGDGVVDASVERSYVGVDFPEDGLEVDLIGGDQSDLLNEEIIVFDSSLIPIDLMLMEWMERTVVNRRMVRESVGSC